MANKTGKGTFKKGKSGNPGGLRKGAVVKANDFKDWAFKFWQDNKSEFEKTILSDDANAMNFMKMIAGFVPKEVDLNGEVKHRLIIVRADDDGSEDKVGEVSG